MFWFWPRLLSTQLKVPWIIALYFGTPASILWNTEKTDQRADMEFPWVGRLASTVKTVSSNFGAITWVTTETVVFHEVLCSWAPCPAYFSVSPSILCSALLGCVLNDWTDGALMYKLMTEEQKKGIEVATQGVRWRDWNDLVHLKIWRSKCGYSHIKSLDMEVDCIF